MTNGIRSNLLNKCVSTLRLNLAVQKRGQLSGVEFVFRSYHVTLFLSRDFVLIT